MGRKLTQPELNKKLPKLYQKHTLMEISAMVGLSPTAIRHRLIGLGCEMRGTGPRGHQGPRDITRHEKIMKMVDDGKTDVEISNRLNVTRQAVGQYVRYYNLRKSKDRRR